MGQLAVNDVIELSCIEPIMKLAVAVVTVCRLGVAATRKQARLQRGEEKGGRAALPPSRYSGNSATA